MARSLDHTASPNWNTYFLHGHRPARKGTDAHGNATGTTTHTPAYTHCSSQWDTPHSSQPTSQA